MASGGSRTQDFKIMSCLFYRKGSIKWTCFPDLYRRSDASLMLEVAVGVVRAAVKAVRAADGVGHRAAAEPVVGQLAASLVVRTRLLHQNPSNMEC